jgi:outer membrane protein TolC
LATVENYRDILVVLYAEIAANYIQVRTLQERIAFAETNLKAQAETMKLTQDRFDSGLVPFLDVWQSKLNHSRTASNIPILKQRLVEAINHLSVLTGQMPYALQQELEVEKSIPLAKKSVTLGRAFATATRYSPSRASVGCSKC